jgi:hypothetical protein
MVGHGRFKDTIAHYSPKLCELGFNQNFCSTSTWLMLEAMVKGLIVRPAKYGLVSSFVFRVIF